MCDNNTISDLKTASNSLLCICTQQQRHAYTECKPYRNHLHSIALDNGYDTVMLPDICLPNSKQLSTIFRWSTIIPHIYITFNTHYFFLLSATRIQRHSNTHTPLYIFISVNDPTPRVCSSTGQNGIGLLQTSKAERHVICLSKK